MATSGKLPLAAVICALVAGLAAASRAKIVYVDDDATGKADGSSWVDAYPYLQDALAIVGAGDEVRVAGGVYRPNQGASIVPSGPHGPMGSTPVQVTGRGEVGLAFPLKNGVTILGGFPGLGAPDPNARDVERHRTVLSGDLYSNDVPGWGPDNPVFESLRTDNSLNVVMSMHVDATAVLDGFTIESGVQGGMRSDGASPQVANCTFRHNGGGREGAGGPALQCIGGQPSLSHCVFEGNSSNEGGGAVQTSAGQLTLRECRFVNNWAMRQGGAIRSEKGDLQLTGCTFEKNAAQDGGAIFLVAGTVTLTDCRFEGNLVSSTGGALFVEWAATASVTDCVFRANRAFYRGGAIRNQGMPLVLTRCIFSGNDGPALYTSADYYQPDLRRVVVAQCLFAGNRTTGSGGAICSRGATLVISDCTFVDNWAAGGSTLAWTPLPPEQNARRVFMNNCIVWDGPEPFAHGDQGPRPMFKPAPLEETIITTYCDVQGGWAGEGNIDADPLFATPGHWADAADPGAVVDVSQDYAVWVDGDHHLKSQAGRWDPLGEDWILDEVTSPCIDAGDPNSPVADEPEPNGGRVNMGAYGGTAEASKSYRNEP